MKSGNDEMSEEESILQAMYKSFDNEFPDYLKSLNKEQLQAVVHEQSPLLILAGAGSGKTRVITTKIAYLISQKNIQPSSILAVTFTKKAAAEMKQRAILLESRAEYAQIRTFHSFGAWFLRKYAVEADLDPNFTLYDDDDAASLLEKAVPSLVKSQSKKMAHYISLAKDYCLKPDDPELKNILDNNEFSGIYAAYQKRLHQSGNVDFGDLIMLPSLIISSNENIKRQMYYRFRVIMVDEYQDSNVAQFKLLQSLAGVENNSGTYVCVVGDDDQSIYKFRGAEVQNILTFKDKFPGTEIVRLEKNYRSTAQILKAANTVVSCNEARLGKTLVSVKGKGKQPVLVFLSTQKDESEFCADLIRNAHDKGCPYNDWAILYRTNAQSLEFETEFLYKNIPYTIVGTVKFYEREEVKDMLAFLAFTANPKDEIAFRRIINKPARGIGPKTQDLIVNSSLEKSLNFIETGRSILKSLSKKAREGFSYFIDMYDSFYNFLTDNESEKDSKNMCHLSEYVTLIAEKSGLLEYHSSKDEIAGTQKAANIQELANSAALYSCSVEGLVKFLEQIELDRSLEDNKQDTEIDTVTLITLHNTKGLEFPRVIITGLEAGIFPRMDKSGDELEEERRLFYVGITRAENQLYLTSCSERRMYGRTQQMLPSPFLFELGKTVSVIGRKPYGFGTVQSARTLDPLAEKWKKGLRLYHDDYGYGQIIKTDKQEDEYIITVFFENGDKKKFMPKYQAHSLMIVRDE